MCIRDRPFTSLYPVMVESFSMRRFAHSQDCHKVWFISIIIDVYKRQTFDIPAIDAMVHHYLHPLRDFIVACLVTSSCCIIHLIFKQQLVLIENEQLQAENLRNQYEVCLLYTSRHYQ